MQNLKILNTREVKKIYVSLKKRFDFTKTLDHVFLQNNKNRIFLINHDFAKVDVSKLRINSLGLYFGEIYQDQLRLSIEASQMIGNDCKKNILDLDAGQAKDWLKGIDLDFQYDDTGFVLIRHKDDFLGCAKATGNKLLNYVPKNRRIRS